MRNKIKLKNYITNFTHRNLLEDVLIQFSDEKCTFKQIKWVLATKYLLGQR